jgi:hypothetical protein
MLFTQAQVVVEAKIGEHGGNWKVVIECGAENLSVEIGDVMNIINES